MYSLQFWKLKVKIKVMAGFFFRGFSPWLANGHLLPLSVLCELPQCLSIYPIYSYKDTIRLDWSAPQGLVLV